MNLPEQLTRRFTNAQIEFREPLRRDLAAQMAEYLASGKVIDELPNKLGTPKRIRERRNQEQVNKDEAFTGYVFTDEEIEAIRYMKACGLTHQQISTALNAHYKTNRTAVSVKSLCTRLKISTIPSYKGVPATRGDGWDGEQDALLKRLTAEGKTCYQVALALKEIGIERSHQGVRGRTLRLGLQINRKGRKA